MTIEQIEEGIYLIFSLYCKDSITITAAEASELIEQLTRLVKTDSTGLPLRDNQHGIAKQEPG